MAAHLCGQLHLAALSDKPCPGFPTQKLLLRPIRSMDHKLQHSCDPSWLQLVAIIYNIQLGTNSHFTIRTSESATLSSSSPFLAPLQSCFTSSDVSAIWPVCCSEPGGGLLQMHAGGDLVCSAVLWQEASENCMRHWNVVQVGPLQYLL